MNPAASDPAPMEIYSRLKESAIRYNAEAQAAHAITIQIGQATCGLAAGARETRQVFAEAIAENGIDARIRTVGCCGHCYAEPVVTIDHPDSGLPPLLYQMVTPGKASLLVRNFLLGGDPCLEHMLGAVTENDLLPSIMAFSRFNLEKRIVMEKCGQVDPEEIQDYIATGGYQALARALHQSPDRIVDTIRSSGLRGRGGAGFATGVKWQVAAHQPSSQKYVICNADEGDPGAYMDRTLIESNPHQVIEGLIIGAYAVGARQAVIYVRAEYPLAVSTLQKALLQARNLGLIGPSILGSDFSLEVTLFEGSGAFVCGEETAMIQSIQGFRGMPRPRPPYPAVSGLFGHPTVINNVKTLASVPPIIANGAEWFRAVGSPESPGTAIFSVVGDVTHPGLVEVPMGVTLRHLIFDVCGGIPNRRKFKAVQIGGPSGGCLPEAFLDTPIDFHTLSQAGAMMGSGGMVVMDDTHCMVDVARFFLDFTQKESCGKCTFCRIGTHHLLTILQRLTRGEAEAGDLEKLARLGADIQAGSLCGLGRTAPNPVLTTLKYFYAEYQDHLENKTCPGLTCRTLMAYYIDLGKCARGCDACVGCCPVEAVFTTSTRKKGIDQALCIKCGECMAACPPQYDAVVKVSPPELAVIVQRPDAQPDGRQLPAPSPRQGADDGHTEN
jgi:NADH-quinone oxidoreductase subunit F